MRMFLIGMCDIFLILYLTSITNVQPQSMWTLDDFYQLQQMHEELTEDKEKQAEEFAEKLRLAKEEKDKLALEKQKEAELAAAKLKDLAELRQSLEAKLSEEESKRSQMEESLKTSNTERDTITKNLEQTEKMLKERESTLAKLNSEIAAQQEERERIEKIYQDELQMQQVAVEENQKLINQMKEQAELAYMAAEEAKTVQKLAVELKEQALEAKDMAEEKAAQALARSYKDKIEKERAVLAMEEAKASRIKAEANVERLATAIQDMTQDGDEAFANNVRPQMQRVNVTYSRKAGNDRLVYKRELLLLPVKIGEKVYLIFPSRQVGFYGRSDKTPEQIDMIHEGAKVDRVLMHRDNDMVAIELSGYKEAASLPYPIDIALGNLMPTLLSLRNNGNINFSDRARNIAEDYFIVKRDFLKKDKDGHIEYDVKGIRGTGAHGERIVQGDQLVDLNGRLIGIANKANNIIQIDSLSDWEEVVF